MEEIMMDDDLGGTPPPEKSNPEEQRKVKSRRVSHVDMHNEKSELVTLLEEPYYIPLNSGSLPKATYNNELDVIVGQTPLNSWIYPASKAFRTYQFKIVRAALFENTLVTLPTGLGKTFIASTVMFNFYRWFSDGLIFFLAPTKPLVSQQVVAFAETIPEVPLSDICELNGMLSKEKRKEAYQRSRIFFMTP